MRSLTRYVLPTPGAPPPLCAVVAGIDDLGVLHELSPQAAAFDPPHYPARPEAADETAERLAQQLEEYFAGQRQTFDLPLRAAGTAFQQEVWRLLREIPWGQTRTYGDLARTLGKPGASRAIGQANGSNPIAIIIPCHRVVASNGLGGYTGGLDIKRALLRVEGVVGEPDLFGHHKSPY